MENKEEYRKFLKLIRKLGNGRAIYKCKCGNEFEASIKNVNRGSTSSCGCYRKSYIAHKSYKHGYTEYELYPIYTSMIRRCYNNRNKDYKNYGARGIQVCEEWLNDFLEYNKYILSLQNSMKKGYSLDRIDNNGNYEPGNLRWVEPHIQAVNQRIYKTNKTGYIGVKKNEFGYLAQINYNGKRYHLGSFRTAEIANATRIDYLIENELYEYLT